MNIRLFKKTRLFVKVMTFALMVLVCPLKSMSRAATNNAIDPGGGSVTLQASGDVTVNAVTLSLVKQARDLSGVLLPDNADGISGQGIYFVLYIDNTTSVDAPADMTDLIKKSQFTYLANSMETTVVPSGSDDTVLWGGVWTPLTDAQMDSLGNPDDTASVTESPSGADVKITIGAVLGQANQTLNITGKTLRAVRFKATLK